MSRKISLLLLSFFALSATDNLVKYRKAVTEYEAHRYSRALQLFGEFMDENPFEPEVKKALFYVTNALALEGRCHEAIARANIALDRYPAHPDKHELRVIAGECLYRVNAHARAEKLLAETQKRTDSKALLYRIEKYRGFIGFDARAYARAAQHYRNALRVANETGIAGDTDAFRIYRDLGTILAADQAQTEAAVDYLSRAIRLGEAQKSPLVGNLRLLLRKISLRRIDKLNGLDDNSIADIRVDGDDVYIATWGGGLVRYTRSQDKLTKLPLPSPQLRGLYVDFEEIFAASFDGLYRLSKKTGKTESLADSNGELRLAQKTIKDDRYIYCSTLTRGLIQYDTIKRKVVTLGKDSWVASNQVYALDADLEYIAVGTLDQGALIHNKKTGETIQVTAGEGALKSENVKAVLLDGRYVYIGAHDDGVYVYDLQQRKLTRLNLELPFPSAFARRENEIFIGTSGQGIRVLDRNNNNVERITAVEGLSSNEVQILRVEGDFIWIGYLENGIDVLFKPAKEK